LAANADEIADFLSHLNPYLQKDIVRGLIATHGAHHVLQINQYKTKDYAPLGATWPMMRQHVYVIADTLTTALAKQFPNKFSRLMSLCVPNVDFEGRMQSGTWPRVRPGQSTVSFENRREGKMFLLSFLGMMIPVNQVT
jgi:hypothetical protein